MAQMRRVRKSQTTQDGSFIIWHRILIVFLAVAALLFLPSSTVGVAEPPISSPSVGGESSNDSTYSLKARYKINNNTLPGKQIWGHYLGYGLPHWDQLVGGDYGDLYFMDLVQGDHATTPRPVTPVQRAQAAGLTGMQVLEATSGTGADFVGSWFDQADPTWLDADPTNDFSIAPVIAEPTKADLSRMVDAYVRAASSRPSASKVNGRYVIYIYGSRYKMSAQDWVSAREELLAKGLDVFVIADLCQDVVFHNWKVPVADIIPYLSSWDATWLFETDTPRLWPEIADLLNSNGSVFAGGINPGYSRESAGAQGGYVDARATDKFRQEWELALAYGTNWQNLVTWNDIAEDTAIEPTSNWNETRSDINAFYSAKLRKVPFPRPTPELYVTAPKSVHIGEPIAAEGMLLNGSSEAATVRVALFDGDGDPVGATESATIDSGHSGAITTAAAPLATRPARGFVRALATSYDSQGNQLQQVTSAPVLVYAAGEKPTPDLRRTYYSIPARAALPATPQVSLDGNPVTGTANFTVSSEGLEPNRFIEVLQNTRLVKRGYDSQSMSAAVPMVNGQLLFSGQVVSSSPEGFYVGRVIDESERVGYSDPIYVK